MGREEEEDELTVSLQGHCTSQGRSLHSWCALWCVGESFIKRLGKGWNQQLLHHAEVWVRHILITPSCGFKDFPGHLPGLGETLSFPQKQAGFIS